MTHLPQHPSKSPPPSAGSLLCARYVSSAVSVGNIREETGNEQRGENGETSDPHARGRCLRHATLALRPVRRRTSTSPTVPTSATTAARTRRSRAAAATHPARTSGGERQQNEPTAAVDPADTSNKMTAGSNDYCTGARRRRTLGRASTTPVTAARTGRTACCPGYPTDTSAEGRASPLVGLDGRARATRCRTGTAAITSVLRRDRVQPHPSRRERLDLGRALQLERAVRRPGLRVHDARVPRDAEPAFALGHFEDKVELEVDGGAQQPVRGERLRLLGALHGVRPEQLHRVRPLDRRRANVDRPQKISESVHGNQECDIGCHANRDGLRDLAAVRVQGEPGPTAA